MAMAEVIVASSIPGIPINLANYDFGSGRNWGPDLLTDFGRDSIPISHADAVET